MLVVLYVQMKVCAACGAARSCHDELDVSVLSLQVLLQVGGRVTSGGAFSPGRVCTSPSSYFPSVEHIQNNY